MRRKLLSSTLVAGVVVAGLGVVGAVRIARATEGHESCGLGSTVVEGVCYRPVVRKVCKVVPEMKKVTEVVYLCEEEDFCLPGCKAPNCTRPHGCQGPCGHPGCTGPRRRKILRKRVVTKEVPGTKCVVESVVEMAPCMVSRKMPCPVPISRGH